jgi:hypothetical protein
VCTSTVLPARVGFSEKAIEHFELAVNDCEYEMVAGDSERGSSGICRPGCDGDGRRYWLRMLIVRDYYAVE